MAKVDLLMSKLDENNVATKSIKTIAVDPNFAVPSIVDIDGHNFEVRHKNNEDGLIAYQLSDSAVDQN